MRTLLIDGDIVAYQIAASSEVATEWANGQWTLHADADTAKQNVDLWLADVLKEVKGDKLLVALTDTEHNWRKNVLPSYKSNRAGTRKPMLLPVLRQHLVENYQAKIKPGLEGDDILGIMSTHPTIVKGERVVVSADKDMRTIPGKFYRLGKSKKIEVITGEEADHYHLAQTLTGDPVDGYKGCPGIGAKRAEAILSGEPETKWRAVVAAYEKAGLTEDDAIVQARVARILRHTDYNFKTMEPILWNPPK